MVPFTGNAFYCYANSLHMTLQGSGADARLLPDPGFLECLTTMPFGNTYLRLDDGPLVFFSGPNVNPDSGLNLALQSLGWSANEHYGGADGDALRLLSEATKMGPALVGPVDLGYLSYNPNHTNLAGIDHYVVVLAVQDQWVVLHDPAGFPYAVIPAADFLLAWQADAVPYKRGPYTLRWAFRAKAEVSRQQMISSTLAALESALTANPSGPVVYGGEKALLLLAQDLRGKIHPRLAGHLLWFALPLAARRATDAARFLAEAGKHQARAIQEHKARLFGEANYHAAQAQWDRVADVVERLASLERGFITAAEFDFVFLQEHSLGLP